MASMGPSRSPGDLESFVEGLLPSERDLWNYALGAVLGGNAARLLRINEDAR